MEWQFRREGADDVSVHYHLADQLMVFRGWVEDGLETCGVIAKEMGVSDGTISKLAKRAIRAGWLRTGKGRRYEIVASSDQRQPYAD